MTFTIVLAFLRKYWLESAVCAAVVAVYFLASALHDSHDKRIDAQGYARALAKANDVQGFLFPAERASLQRRIDSLTRITAKQDTQLVASIAKVRALLARPTIQQRLTVADTFKNAPILYTSPERVNTPYTLADTSLRNACTALANDCDAYRKHARETIDAATQQATMERNANVALSFRLVAEQDDHVAFRASVAKQSKWRVVERSVCAASVGVNVLAFLK